MKEHDQTQSDPRNDAPARDPNKPYEKHRDGAMEIAIWKRETDKGSVYNTDLKRSYKDEQGNWQTSHSLGERDLLKAARLQEQAYTSIQTDREYDRVLYMEQQKQSRAAPVQAQAKAHPRER